MTNPADRARAASGSTDGATPVGEKPRRRPWWLLALVGAVLLALLLLGLSRCGGDDDDQDTATPAATTASASPSGLRTPTTAPSTAAPDASAGSPGAGAAGGTLVAGTTNLLPLASAGVAGGDLSRFTGQQVTGKGVTVQSVPSDEGFWVGSSATDRVWVQLEGPGESPVKVKPGQQVDFRGRMTAHTGAFPEQAGVTAAEGAAQLTAQKQHVEADRSTLALTQ